MVSIVILIVLIRLFSETPKIDSIVMGLFRLLKNKIIPNYSSAEYYNTTAKRQKWFNNLEDEWKILFKFQLQDFNEMISDEAINTIFSKKELEINLDGYKNLSGLRNLTNLKVLTIHNYSNTDLSDLKGLKNLRAIKIYHTNFSNGIPIGILSTITHLALHNCEIESLYDFNHLPKLEMLILDNNRITTINSLKKLTKLSYLIPSIFIK